MDRATFLKTAGLLGIGLPLLSPAKVFGMNNRNQNKTDVIVIGAGAAGLTAAYLLLQQGVSVKVLEASTTHGGRMKRTLDFADFPIPLGAEWFQTANTVLPKIVNDPSVIIDFKTSYLDPKMRYGDWGGETMRYETLEPDPDQKIIGSSWLDFFNTYIYPSVSDAISFQEVVKRIDYTKNKVAVETESRSYEAQRVIVTVPVKQLQLGAIEFAPGLSKKRQKTLQKVNFWDGFKAFIVFESAFYPDFVNVRTKPRKAGQKYFYDAAYGQASKQAILALFAVGEPAKSYVNLPESEQLKLILHELDTMFDGAASKQYVKHVFQNWNTEPFIGGSYVSDHEKWRRVRRLGRPIGDKVYFAGDAYTDGEDWGYVHIAALSAKRAVEAMLG